MRDEIAANRALALYADMVRRICFLHLRNNADVEDVFKDGFLKYILHDKEFESDDHEKAWLLRVSINACRDMLKSFRRKKVTSIETMDVELSYIPHDEKDVLDAVLQLQSRYRETIYLHYYEGYSAVEIARVLKRSENTVYTWLSRARKLLKEQLGGEALE
jgi:RNA polymerase sigma-70 factor (ECF subfamily)